MWQVIDQKVVPLGSPALSFDDKKALDTPPLRSNDSTAVNSPEISYPKDIEAVDAAAVLPVLTSAAKPVASNFRPTPRFWLIFAAIQFCMVLSALDLAGVGNLLPTLASQFESPNIFWVGSSYALASTAVISLMGSLSSIFGRKVVLLLALAAFLTGSIVAATAKEFNSMIVGRAVQGLGGGTILVTCNMLIADLVPLSDRAVYMGYIGIVWSLASTCSPIISGALSGNRWPWFWWLNLPIIVIATVLLVAFLQVKTPPGTLKEKIRRVDYSNFLLIGSSTSFCLAMSWGGITYSWKSAQSLVPLIIGVVGMVTYLPLQKLVAHPTLPKDITASLTTCIAYLTVFTHAIVIISLTYFLPIFFQILGHSPLGSAVHSLPLFLGVAPPALITAAVIKRTQKYKAQNIFCWACLSIGVGLMSTFKATPHVAQWVCYPMIAAVGAGGLYPAALFPATAPHPGHRQPAVMIGHAFSRALGQVVGVSLGTTIFLNELKKNLPTSLSSLVSDGNDAFGAIVKLKLAPPEVQAVVKSIYVHALTRIWLALAVISAVSFFLCFLMKSLPLSTETDEAYGMEDDKASDEEKA